MKSTNIAIVGSNRGIGLQLTRQLSQKGNNVFAFCRKKSKDLESLSTVEIIENFDVSDTDKMNRILEKKSLRNIDLMIHVSGVLKSDHLETVDEEDIIEQFKINALAPLFCVKAFLPYLSPMAKIALITSRMGSVSDNTSGGMYGYRVSKAALNMIGKSLAEDLRVQKKTVLLLHPGFVKTDMTGHQGHISAEESAKGLIKVISEKTMSDTGTFWHTNGEPLPW